MTKKHQTMGVTALSLALVLTSGCVNPDGTQNNTGTGALVGGAFGALVGGATGGRHAGQNALIGAAAGVLAGAIVGSIMDAQQRERLQQQSPQTLATVQRNEQLAAQPPPPPPPGQAPAPADAPTALKVTDIKALAAAGVKPDAIIQAIKESKAGPYSASDIAAAQQATPPLDPTVIAYMRNPTT